MLRRALVSDIPTMIEIVVKNDKRIKRDAEEEIIEIFHNKHGEFFIYEQNNNVAGFMGYKAKKWGGDDIYWAVWLYVDPKYKRKGVGTALYGKVEEEIKLKGGRKIYIDVGNEDSHKEAIKFHEKNGYELEAILKDFWEEGEHCLLYTKKLV
ncbi:GNAT family N-acetyltransferase [Evansella clarkii]|uniref:GNAT family N-acetyltransferase n=1 Tax=Evansella clarkii TaxID=79879 RepID=UPI000B44AB17|nr:GNAT family N-acetyltransferase [Evansella clarkii]